MCNINKNIQGVQMNLKNILTKIKKVRIHNVNIYKI